MEFNSTHLSIHLKNILCLTPDKYESPTNQSTNISDQEIMDQAVQHDLPIFVSIDGSVDDKDNTMVSISIVGPDIRESDFALEWKERTAKVLLIRFWCLPSRWGTSKVCINMAESLGFILGEYTIPAHMPVIYITDSNNARTLKRHLTCIADFTHRKQVRSIKQGIDNSIANHLEHLLRQRPSQERLSEYNKRLYKRGERVVRIYR